MAYPESYDTIEDLDLAECARFSHVLEDGIVETADEIEMDAKYFAFAKYGSGTPLLSIVDPIMDEYLLENAEGVFQDKTGLWKFDIDIPENETSVGDTLWRETRAILKLHSDESDLLFQKHVKIILKACSMADMCNMMTDTLAALGDVQAAESKQSQEIVDLKNGWRAIY